MSHEQRLTECKIEFDNINKTLDKIDNRSWYKPAIIIRIIAIVASVFAAYYDLKTDIALIKKDLATIQRLTTKIGGNHGTENYSILNQSVETNPRPY